MITKQEVEHIAKLARLKLTVDETKKMQKELSAIFDYFSLLEKVKDKAAPISLTENKVVLREDKANISVESSNEDLLKAVPEKEKRHIKVKAIL